MPVFGPIKRADLVHYLRQLGFSGPYSGGKHQLMLKGDLALHIPNPHQGILEKNFWLEYCGKLVLIAPIGKNSDSSRRSAVLLKGEDGSEIELCLTRYQFSEIEDDHWDSNWLMIALRVQTPQGSWHTVDPALLTLEVQELADWLEALANNQPTSSSLEFTEPCLPLK